MRTTKLEQDNQATATDPPLILPFGALDRGAIPIAGGKSANLGELTRAGFSVPSGFCLTTRAYTEVADRAGLAPLLAALDRPALASVDYEQLAAQIRAAILAVPVPDEVRAATLRAYADLGEADAPAAVAVRSSATAEDLPEASFAGQQETLLNVIGADALLDAVQRCWASLWTDRAVAYRAAKGVDQRTVALAVAVQKMVSATVSGVLFTANPLTNRHGEAVIDAAPGLGEALVSGMVNPSHFVVDTRTLQITARRLAPADRAIQARAGGGTEEVRLQPAADAAPCLSDAQVQELAQLGARVEAHYGAPMDIEWSFDAGGKLWLLQARPITTLFPAVSPAGDEFGVYFSMSTAQGVLQPITPLGQDFFRLVATGIAGVFGMPDPARSAAVVRTAAGRLYINIAPLLRTSIGRRIIGAVLTNMEPLTGAIVRGLLDDRRLALQPHAADRQVIAHLAYMFRKTRLPLRFISVLAAPSRARRAALARVQSFLAGTAAPVVSPREALDQAEWLARQTPERVLLPLVPAALIGGIALFQLIRHLAGPDNAADAMLLTRGLPHNPTTQMNLRLWGISRRLRADKAVATLLTTSAPADLAAGYQRGELPPLLQHAVRDFLRAYGFRGVAEIDLGVPRWSEDPGYFFTVIANYLKQEAGAAAPDAQFRRAQAEAADAYRRIVTRMRQGGPRGQLGALLLRFLYSRMRALLGLREAPKFYAVAAIAQCRRLALTAGEALVAAGRLTRSDDIFFLTFAEARAALDGTDQRLLAQQRRADYARETRRRRLPRVLLSDGTALYGEAPPLPAGSADALAGTPASPGIYRGRARVILDPAGAHIEPGEILVAPSTDPGWTPLFLSAGALVMEMGGMMSHGAVVAREYGIPAVVGLPNATSAIKTGQRITVDGQRGIVLLRED